MNLEVINAFAQLKIDALEKDREIVELKQKLSDANKALEDTYRAEDISPLFTIYEPDGVYVKDEVKVELIGWFKGEHPFPTLPEK